MCCTSKAVRVRFELTVPKRDSCFQDRCVRPLRHLTALEILLKELHSSTSRLPRTSASARPYARTGVEAKQFASTPLCDASVRLLCGVLALFQSGLPNSKYIDDFQNAKRVHYKEGNEPQLVLVPGRYPKRPSLPRKRPSHKEGKPRQEG